MYNQQTAAYWARVSWDSLTPEQRRARAQHAVRARWAKHRAAKTDHPQLSIAEWLAGLKAEIDAQGKRNIFVTRNLARLHTALGL